jgi:hypothetical protein
MSRRRPCRWCAVTLRSCLILHINNGQPCCKACDHGGAGVSSLLRGADSDLDGLGHGGDSEQDTGRDHQEITDDLRRGCTANTDHSLQESDDRGGNQHSHSRESQPARCRLYARNLPPPVPSAFFHRRIERRPRLSS